jgi:hypothetical protein
MSTCKNCQNTLSLDANYCEACGGRVIRNRLTIKNLFVHFVEHFLSYDNKFLKTFINLFKKPEDVIVSYITGTRKKYINAIQYFAIALTITGLQWFIVKKFFPELMDITNLAQKGTEEMAQRNVNFVQEYISIFMMLFIPLYALVSRTVFFNIKTFNYTEHIVIFMYIIAQISIAGAVFNLIGVAFGMSLGTLAFFTGPFQLIFTAYCLKRLYKLDFLNLILRTLIFIVVCIVFTIGFTVIYFLGAYIFLGKEGFMEMIKTQNAMRGI